MIEEKVVHLYLAFSSCTCFSRLERRQKHSYRWSNFDIKMRGTVRKIYKYASSKVCAGFCVGLHITLCLCPIRFLCSEGMLHWKTTCTQQNLPQKWKIVHLSLHKKNTRLHIKQRTNCLEPKTIKKKRGCYYYGVKTGLTRGFVDCKKK